MSPQRIKMNVTDQLSKIDLLITDDGMITVLKEMAMPAMAKVVSNGVTSKETPHEFRKARRTAP
jgi:hypothetical protein